MPAAGGKYAKHGNFAASYTHLARSADRYIPSTVKGLLSAVFRGRSGGRHSNSISQCFCGS